jgi:serine/threonine-protein kinase
LAVSTVALLAGYGTWHSTFGRQLELNTVGARFSLRGNEPAGNVAVVGIDADTIAYLGSPPLPRRYDAEMIDVLRRDGARVIAYDLVFDGPSASPNQDSELLRAATRARARLVLAGSATNAAGSTAVLGGARLTVGSALFSFDANGQISQVAARPGGFESFAAAAARLAGAAPRSLRSDFAAGPVWIDFPGPAGTVPTYGFVEVLDGKVAEARLRGKIVVVGATDPVLQDTHAVPDGSAAMPGPELQADAIATLLAGAPLRATSAALDWLFLIVAALALPLLAYVRRPWPWIAMLGLTGAFAYLVASQLAFDSGTITLVVPVVAALIVAGVGAVLVPLALERRELRLLRDRFARFDPVVVNAVLADPGVALRLRALAIGPESVIAGYRIVRLAGRGGMGVVYEAIQLNLGRPVALKLIDPAHADDPELRARFIRESRAAASLAHPHVIPVYEAGEDGGLLFITMRLVRGGSLHDLMSQRGPLAPALAASIGAQVASALQAAHQHGLVHRDVKPANVLLELGVEGESQHCYLTDFGVTREGPAGSLTVVGERIGTLDYMAPEQARGEEVGPQADLYSLGCVLFEALTGSVPYPRGSDPERIAAHAAEPVPIASERWPGVPVAFDAVLARALAKEPAERFESGLDFATTLLAAAGIEPVGVVARAAVTLAVANTGATVITPPA